MRAECPHCGTAIPCIECADFMCSSCGEDLAECKQQCKAPPLYRPSDNDNDGDE